MKTNNENKWGEKRAIQITDVTDENKDSKTTHLQATALVINL